MSLKIKLDLCFYEYMVVCLRHFKRKEVRKEEYLFWMGFYPLRIEAGFEKKVLRFSF